MKVILMKNNLPLMKGPQEDVRERIELMLEERLGLYLELQESTDEGEFQIYLHTDTYDYLSEKEIEQLETMKITDDPERSTEGLKRLLNVDFQVVD